MLIIGIAGGTGSGKTSVAHSVIDKLGKQNVNLISQDNYYLDHSDLPFAERELINYDHPLAFDDDLLLKHLNQLKLGHKVRSPLYDFANHARSSETVEIDIKPIVIVEGLHVLSNPALREIFDIKVFVDTDPDVRILRRVVRDIHERGRTIQSIHDQYLSTVKPMHDAFIEPSKKYADIIIPEGAHNEVGISLLTIWTEKYINGVGQR
ncbi:uridine kinase [Paenibacillus hamazuiensis]|uniref:uridine kinase n=1 Tax=Paenibacillus hamazuiensis TaxID=2936508 RepID=UPI00200E9B27|nr:uridine kinase [Paenibacillus hamazuiensis]